MTTVQKRVVAVLTVVGLVALGINLYRFGQENAHHAADIMAARDQKILSVIVKRNPQASIREFMDFPAVLTREAATLGLDFRYVMALIDTESEWHPEAVSSKCAVGLMQVMPGTAADVVAKTALSLPDDFKFVFPVKDKSGKRCYESVGSLGDPRVNIMIGMRYLRTQIDDYGLGPEHLRAYNRGPSLAKAHWPNDRYAENVALKFVALAGTAGVPLTDIRP